MDYIRMKFIQDFLIEMGVSVCHGWEGPCLNIGKKRRQRTAYVDDKSNWVFLCDDCMSVNDTYWTDMWNDYYRSVL